ncbi:MAG: hypothetical protein IRZ15_08140 [Bryobacteraceae bacterium]|nr:hypothetical protein [Bryobacteraceae bacterium]
MTKVEKDFGLTRQVTEADMNAIARAHSVYGIHLVRLSPTLDSIHVEYDASRLTEFALESALVRCGIPLQRKEAAVGHHG